MALHRTREFVVRQRTQVANMIRGLLREFGRILPTGVEAVTAFSKRHLDAVARELKERARMTLNYY